MAPQIYDNKKYNYKSDTWSLGVILFEMLNKRTPFQAKSRKEFEKKLKGGLYHLQETDLENITIETMLFLSDCLQYNEG